MELLKNKNILKCFILYLLISTTSCVKNEPFTIEKWNLLENDEYLKRKNIVKDLIENHLKDGMCYQEIIDLLGTKVTIANDNNAVNHIYFDVQTKWGSDIDPDWEKCLEVILNQDSCFIEARVVKF